VRALVEEEDGALARRGGAGGDGVGGGAGI
jgi:hypothetical protein